MDTPEITLDTHFSKANFDAIYTSPDPREYFRVLYGLDYVIPDLAKGTFRSLMKYCAGLRGRPPKIVDLGSSYGINAALLRYPLDIDGLARRYGAPEMSKLSWERLAALDRQYFRSWPGADGTEIIGVDTSVPAVSYAVAVGLLNDAVTTDLETSDPTKSERELLADVDLIISTGCVGYVSHRTFRRIIACQRTGRLPLVASFVLRIYPYDEIEAELARHGLVTEKLQGVTFVQRRFESAEECKFVLAALESRGIDPTGKEAEGLFHAELYVSRPQAEVDELPLSELVSVTRGSNRRYGRRFRSTGDGDPCLVH